MTNKNHSYKENLLIMGGHLADDLCQGSLPAILAFMYHLHNIKKLSKLIMNGVLVISPLF